MEKLVKKIREIFTQFAALLLSFLCASILVQLLLPEGETLFGWDPINNVKEGGNAFIGVISIILLYILFVRREQKK